MNRTAVLSLYHENYQPLADLVLPNWQRYCKTQGYALRVFRGHYGKGSIGYQKMRYLYDEMFVKSTTDLAWVIDLDVLITNHTRRIEEFLNGRDTYYLCLEPWAKINHGSFIVVKSPSSKRLIEFILSHTEKWGDEQTVMNCEIFDKGTWPEHFIGLLPHPSINSFLAEIYVGKERAKVCEANWKKGHFALHLIALPLNARIKIFRDLMRQVIYTKEQMAAFQTEEDSRQSYENYKQEASKRLAATLFA